MTPILRSFGAGYILDGRAASWVLVHQLGPLGQSRRSSVWLAHTSADEQRRAAIKLGVDATSRALVCREIQRLEGMAESDYVVEMLDACESLEADIPWFATPIADDGSLAQVYAALDRRRLRDLLRFALNTVQGLSDSEVVHRDLRPENLLIYDGPHGEELRISDWARSIVHGAPQPRELAPMADDFAAPQVLWPDTNADIRDDLLSIGAIVWWGCTGTAPIIAPAPGEQAKPTTMLLAEESQARLGELYPDVPRSVVDLVTGLLSPSREGRSPALDGRRAYLSWLSEGFQNGIIEVERAEARSGSNVTVGPGAAQLMRAHKVEIPRYRTDVGERTSSGSSPPREAAPKVQPIPPKAQQPQHAPATGASPRSKAPERVSERRMPDSQVGREIYHDSRSRQRRALWYSIGLVFSFHVIAGILIFEPSGTFTGPLAAIGALLVAAAIGSLDTLIAVRLGGLDLAIPRWETASTRALLGARVLIAVAVALFTTQALMVRGFSAELTMLRTSEHESTVSRRHSLTSALSRLNAEQAREAARFGGREATLSREAEGVAGGGAKVAKATAGAPQLDIRRLRTIFEAQAGIISSQSGRQASLAARRSTLLRELASTRASRSKSAGRVQLLYRYMQGHASVVAVYAALLLLIVAMGLMPTLLARLIAAARTARYTT